MCRRVDRADGPLRAGMMMPGSRSHFDKWGFWIVTGERWGDDHHAAFFPGWFLAMMTLALPAGRAVAHLQTLPHRRRGHCRACGYDLRASPGRCPECGTIAANAAPG